LHELQGKETARHKGGRGGKKELTGGESSDELTRTKTEQIEGEEGVEVRYGDRRNIWCCDEEAQ
jgi:hypothetical protein